ncbi:thiamine pyrophosphate-binding protein [Kordiimonas sp. SCSIO 12610]|uniref:thiamine pyrophosphate-binding protein n=1 Tax=Kordiimonas sp. SCSIO 12610 TaxID=2829597 RepID=UPI00210E9017|nr:thiamine pyrophosphate-binding protein [Kordiimonas sp. SCSIO 12610]UTW55023.1 thiamine pyrophosphate-binding protein [Kordiimonas sp. SCSIO 12610]
MADNHMITGGKALIDALLANGAKKAFGVPGESYLAALDALHDVQGELDFVICRHEASAANMAEAYGKLTGEPGICFVTRGPGTTHATIGLHTAFQDSTPMIMLIGQVAADQVEREAFQEIDYRRFLSEVTKWTAEINDASRIAEYIGRAFRVATSGRPGPVALALPEDMLRDLCAPQNSIPYTPSLSHPGQADLDQLKSLMDKAERPLLMLGGSGWDKASVASIQSFAENNNLPVCVSFRCQDRFDNNHPNYAGDMGIGANPKLIKRMQEADVLLVLGPRLGEMTTGGYERLNVPVPDQTLIHIHQGAEELGRVYQPDLAINASPKTFAPVLATISFENKSNWAGRVKEARTEFEAWTASTDNPGDVKVAALYEYMRSALPEDAILCNGAGNYAAWLHRFHRYQTFPSQLAPTSGAMGYGVPAAIAAKITHPDRTVIACAGDGCFMMSAMELATAAQYNANVIFLVFNNSMFGTIRMHQERDYPARVSGTELENPDFVKLAESFGMFADRVEKTDQFAPALEAAMKANRPALIEIIIDPDAIAPTATISGLRSQ